MTDAPYQPHTLGRPGVFIVLGAAIIVIFALLGFRSTLTEHEVFAAEPARELLDGGSLVLQQFAGEYRTKKPPGQSWLIAASLFVTQSHSEYSARLPSALAATGLALVAGAIGSRLLGRRGGIVAGLMTLTCYAVQVRARLAEADMTLAFFVAMSFAGMLLPLLRLRRSTEITDAAKHEQPFKPGRYGFLFWLALGGGFLIKGPIALMFVLPPVVLLWLFIRFTSKDRPTLRVIEMVFLNPYALVLGLAMIVGWPVAAYLTHPEVINQWKYELASRAMGEIRRDPIWAYFGFVSLGTLPWCVFAFSMIGQRATLRRPIEALLALWFVSGFVLLSVAIAFKAQHYCLPILLPIILASAAGFDRLVSNFVAKKPLEAQARTASIVIAGWFVFIGAACIANQWFIEPGRMNKGGIKPFAAEIQASVPVDQPIYLVDVGEERVVWYVKNRSIQTRKRDDEKLETQLERLPPQSAFAICPASSIEEIRTKVRSLDVIATSADYRGRDDGAEKRALVRIER